MRTLSHKTLSLNLKKLNYLENHYEYFIILKFDCKIKKDSGRSGMGNFEVNNSSE